MQYKGFEIKVEEYVRKHQADTYWVHSSGMIYKASGGGHTAYSFNPKDAFTMVTESIDRELDD